MAETPIFNLPNIPCCTSWKLVELRPPPGAQVQAYGCYDSSEALQLGVRRQPALPARTGEGGCLQGVPPIQPLCTHLARHHPPASPLHFPWAQPYGDTLCSRRAACSLQKLMTLPHISPLPAHSSSETSGGFKSCPHGREQPPRGPFRTSTSAGPGKG